MIPTHEPIISTPPYKPTYCVPRVDYATLQSGAPVSERNSSASIVDVVHSESSEKQQKCVCSQEHQ